MFLLYPTTTIKYHFLYLLFIHYHFFHLLEIGEMLTTSVVNSARGGGRRTLRACSVIFNPYGLEGIDTDSEGF
jgi:hypothetical protein